eukprot:GDKI01044668.1.p1 GENE.GDKI01044668.1~~GDKI01044668.1.p1  ORF type:complete len:140 (+),score=32.39 GDKI01044668.1:185-604(+)
MRCRSKETWRGRRRHPWGEKRRKSNIFFEQEGMEDKLWSAEEIKEGIDKFENEVIEKTGESSDQHVAKYLDTLPHAQKLHVITSFKDFQELMVQKIKEKMIQVGPGGVMTAELMQQATKEAKEELAAKQIAEFGRANYF